MKLTKQQILAKHNMSEDEFYQRFPDKESYELFANGGTLQDNMLGYGGIMGKRMLAQGGYGTPSVLGNSNIGTGGGGTGGISDEDYSQKFGRTGRGQTGAGTLSNTTTDKSFNGNKTMGYVGAAVNGIGSIINTVNNPNLTDTQKAQQTTQNVVDTGFQAVGTAIPVVGAAYGIGKTAGSAFDKIGTGQDKLVVGADGKTYTKTSNEGSQITGDQLKAFSNPSSNLSLGAKHIAEGDWGKAALDVFLGSVGTTITQSMDRKEQNAEAAKIQAANDVRNPYTFEQTNRNFNSNPTLDTNINTNDYLGNPQRKYGGNLNKTTFAYGGDMGFMVGGNVKHESSPQGGIPMGANNLVESKEYLYGDYVFSDRLPYKK